jgi:hypothetical protein
VLALEKKKRKRMMGGRGSHTFTTHAGILEGYLVSVKGKVAGTNPLGNEDINMLGSTRLDPGCY